jgi:protein-disulfide isomerase
MHIHSSYADKICSLLGKSSKSDCNNVLELEAAKLWGIFGWSEIGLGYFTANVLLLLFLPQTISLLALINIATLPYSFWSVWYQKVKAKQWCPLCLIVQVLLWTIFIANCLFGYIQIQLFNYSVIQLLFIGSIYSIFVFGFNLLLPNLSRGNEVEKVKQEINSIKADKAVFRTLLTQQPYYEVSHADSQIIFGNPNADLKITILTNPFCNPCAKTHKRVEKLLHDTNRKVCVQYILSSFGPELEYANKYLIAAWLTSPPSPSTQRRGGEEQSPDNGLSLRAKRSEDPQSPEQIFADWFEKGKPLKEKFFENLQLDMTNPAIETEFQKHNVWKEKTQLRATPTILVNDYKLPDNYKIEDLRNFS